MLTTGTYKTRCGYDVNIFEVKLKNDAGENVTFPLKGNYFTPTKTGKMKSHYTIWQADGKHTVFGDNKLDIVW